MSRVEAVSIAEIKAGKGPITYNALGLGSCVAICMLDVEVHVSVSAHIMLPASFEGKPVDQPGKFANTAVPEMLAILTKYGGDPARTIVSYAGGAQVFQFSSGNTGKLDIGARNAEAVKNSLALAGMKVVASDVGGSSGRTVVFNSETGVVFVKSFSKGESELCNMRNGIRRAA